MAGERIVIVEDEKIIALDLQRRLERFGYTVIGLASDGAEALDHVAKSRPDLVLMDIMLAGDMDGIEAACRIKSSYGTPVIFLTAFADEKTLERAKEAEPYGYILKPFKERELYTTVDIALYKITVERRLKAQEQLFSAILHSINDGIIAIDVNMVVSFMNPVAERITGYLEEEAKGKTIGQVVSITDPATRRSLFSLSPQILDSGSYSFKEAVIKNRHEKSVMVEGSFMRIHEQNNLTEGYLLVMNDVTELKRMSATIDYQASHDSLTGLMNRAEYTYKLNELFKELRWKEGEHALVVMDVDRFKVVNDTAGPLAGDELLKQIARKLEQLTQKGDICARLGGDEFALILKNCTAQDAVSVARRLQEGVAERKFAWQSNSYQISLSIGVVPIDPACTDVQSIQASADDACYLSREEGGNRINVFKSGESKFLQRRGEMEWIGKLNRAIEHDRFVLYYQPIMPLASDSRLRPKIEVLLRLSNEDGTVASPGSFIPAAERYNLMPAIDRWVVSNSMRAFRHMKSRHDSLASCMMSINLSGPSILDETIERFILNELGSNGLDASDFCFEITETSAIQNLTYASRFMNTMKEQGFKFSLDDFGSGFSSFSYLKNLPVDYLKLDGSFVQNIDESKISYAMVDSFNSIGHVMGLKTIGEFVKTEAVSDTLRLIGVDYAQGYFISEPKPLPV